MYQKLKKTDLNFNTVVGNYLKVNLLVDRAVSITNVHKITKFDSDGVIRVECINPLCSKKECTYLDLTESEIRKVVLYTGNNKTSHRVNEMIFG